MRRVPLRARDGSVRAFALVDDEDYAGVSRFRWSLHSRGYACRQPASGTVLLHRFLLGLERGDRRLVDHKNRDRLDCRRVNMRVVTPLVNGQNVRARGGSSRFRGVRWFGRLGRWQAQAMIGGVYRHVGYFVDEVEAALAVSALRLAEMPGALPDPELVKLGLA